MQIVKKYFSNLEEGQIQKLGRLKELYEFWNAQINVISRKDMDAFYERHVLHSLGIAKVHQFQTGHRVLDIGTGGGFPGIPLAIMYPETEFYLVDSIAKKIKVVQAVADDLALKNVKAQQLRAEKAKGQFDFIVSRAVTQMPRFLMWTKGKIKSNSGNGIFYLKGGNLSEELAGIKNKQYSLSDFFEEEFFETKKVVFVPV